MGIPISYTDSHHYAIERNIVSGQIVFRGPNGMRITPPWVQVVRIDIRPIRACVDCSCNNIDCRLISFNISGYLEFIEKEGFGYYWWRNRLSFNYGNKLEYRGLPNVLRGYAFDDKNYKFLNVE